MHESFTPFNQAWSRGLFLLFICIVAGYITHQFRKIARVDLIWFSIIALCGGLNQAPYYFGFDYLPIGTATLLFYVSLILGGYLVGKLVMHENIDKTKVLSLFLSVVGMGIIYRFSLSPSQIFPATMTVLAGLMGAGSAVLPKKLSSDYSELQILTFTLASMFICNLVIAIVLNQTLPEIQLNSSWLGWLAYAISLLIANLTVIAGFKYIDATWGSILGTTEIIFAIVFGIVFFSESLTTSSVVGGLIMLLAILLPYIPVKLLRIE